MARCLKCQENIKDCKCDFRGKVKARKNSKKSDSKSKSKVVKK